MVDVERKMIGSEKRISIKRLGAVILELEISAIPTCVTPVTHKLRAA
jgi:hypothetical protein